MCLLFQVRHKKSHKRSHRQSHSHSQTTVGTATATVTASTGTSLSSSHSTISPLPQSLPVNVLSPYRPASTTMCPTHPQFPYQVPYQAQLPHQPSPLNPNFMHLFGGLNMGWNADIHGEQARQIRNASVHRDINFVDELKERVNSGPSTAEKRDRDVGKMLEMLQARDRKEEIAKAKAEGVRLGEEKARNQGQGGGAGTGWGNGVGGGENCSIGSPTPPGTVHVNTLNPNSFCPVHGQIYGRPCYHSQAHALIGNGRGVAGYFGP